jgi:two-component system chemotaxis response regulator CheB
MSDVGRSIPNANVVDDDAAAIVVIAVSAGGLAPLRRIIRELPSSFAAAVVIAQHVRDFTTLPEILTGDTTLSVSLVSHRMCLRAGTIYVCPAQQHVVVNPNATLTLSDRARLGFFRPSADWLFESAAASFRERTFAIVLSGMQNDGAKGAQCVKAAGGTLIAQDPQTCERPEMPSAAIATGAIDHVLGPDAIAMMLRRAVAAVDVARCRAAWAAPWLVA